MSSGVLITISIKIHFIGLLKIENFLFSKCGYLLKFIAQYNWQLFNII